VNCVILRGGVSVLAGALQLAWALEAKGAMFLIDEYGRLRVGPPDILTPADIAAIRENKYELARITKYRDDLYAGKVM
jgi:hypothetical protein